MNKNLLLSLILTALPCAIQAQNHLMNHGIYQHLDNQLRAKIISKIQLIENKEVTLLV